MNVATLTPAQRKIRESVRWLLMTATAAELATELRISIEEGDTFRAKCVRELLAESDQPSGKTS